MKCINNIILYIKYIRTNLKALSVSVGGAHLWNEVDSNLRNTKNILLFKTFQKGCTINIYNYDITDWES